MIDRVPLEVRRERVRRGSRRQRDLQAVADAEQLELLAGTQETDAAARAWAAARKRLAEALPQSTFRMWLEPLRLAGEAGGALHLVAPSGIASWVERRYLGLIAEAVRAVSVFETVSIGARA